MYLPNRNLILFLFISASGDETVRSTRVWSSLEGGWRQKPTYMREIFVGKGGFLNEVLQPLIFSDMRT